ncbi:MAG: high-potential iron-sulfur protein [Bdellovibrionales bacterium]|nr:high-potential iron-sulfur protein [Bdellovibrionales bacterium]
MKAPVSRRTLLLSSLLSVPVLALSQLGSKAFAEAKKALKMLDMKSKDPDMQAAIKTAGGLGYVADSTAAVKAGTLKKKETSGKKPEEVHCKTCNFYVEVDGKKGTCTLIPNVYVAADAYCNTYVVKPAKKG